MRTLLTSGISLFLMGGVAVAQTATSTPEQSQVKFDSQGATFSFDRGVGQGKIEIECAEGDTTRGCVEAVLPLLEVFSPDDSLGVAYATTSIKCGNTVSEVSTGTTGGNCSVAGPEGGPRESAGCNDGDNRAGANCQTGCGATTGSGSCTIKSAN